MFLTMLPLAHAIDAPACATVKPEQAARAVREAEIAVNRAAEKKALWLNAQEALERAKTALAKGNAPLAGCEAADAKVFAELGIRQLEYPPYR
jgi:hypothetical protein